ncbi:hypothetical protein SAMN05216339_102148 [Nitrosomonas eutropha]|uniref:Lipoprotein n=1 Tax=Nitrosomonas eutropha TaxID=916 RepID=A0A1I7G1J7_9PROT|nr:hypothetical protein [Nitrosomonas eutropha]SFU42338.1 hypothetical protein SAMN05216339_102148 [Nitrosomonas eutropha]
MKLLHILIAAMITAVTLTGCLDTDKPANYPPSMSMERDSMPDNVDKSEHKTEQNKN